MGQEFLRFRMNFIKEKKYKEYVVFALGEMLLIAIGILLALQIDKWNEYRKERLKEQTLLQQLKKEYESDLEQLESKISIRGIIIKNSQKIISYIDNPDNVDKDSIIFALSQGNYRPTFDPIVKDILSSDELALIQNEDLKELLSHWATNVKQLNELEGFWENYVINVKYPYFAKKKLTRKIYYLSSVLNWKPYLLEERESYKTLFSDSKQEINYIDILSDPELEAIMTLAIYQCNDANLESETLKNNLIKILDLINLNIVK